MNEKIRQKLSSLDSVPGVYLMKNKHNEIIYVGKAKKLDNRVNQYFNRPHADKTQKMVTEIDDFDFIITRTETDALLLEMNLIHRHDPRYNVLLKDNKSYPYIQIKNDVHPYLTISRNAKDKKSHHFGPYPDSGSAYEILRLLNQLFPLRKCPSVPHRECLYYHLGQCLAPCIKEIGKEDYKIIIDQISQFMGGNSSSIKKDITAKMQLASEKLKFEQANEYKKLLNSIEYIQSKQTVMYNDGIDRDVFAFHSQDENMAIAILIIRNGILINKITDVISIYESVEEAFLSYITQYYDKNISPKEVIIPNLEDVAILEGVLKSKILTPKQGVKLELIQMAAQNAIKAMENRHLSNKDFKSVDNQLFDQFSKLLDLKEISRVELVDNSHLSGQDGVAAVVVFENGLPNKKLYRKYKLALENAGDDYGSMIEVMTRRFSRIKEEGTRVSDVLIVDGGLIQIQAAKKVIDKLGVNINIFGLVKDKKHNTRTLIDINNKEIITKEHPQIFFMLARMQDEVHRFAINYHRDLRSKSLTSSILDSIAGLGKVRKNALLKNFGTINKIKQASLEELSQYLPINVAKQVKEALAKDVSLEE
jgi:excinuclease ABC subunit C